MYFASQLWLFSLLSSQSPISPLTPDPLLLHIYSEKGRPPMNINKIWHIKLQ